MAFPALDAIRRAFPIAIAAAFALAGALQPADAAPKKADKRAAKTDESAKPALIATFGDWNVFAGRAGKGRICYALAQPKSREPSSLKREAGYAFISDRPAEGVRNEVSFIMGFDISAGAEADAKEARPAGKASKSDARSKKAMAAPVALVDEASFDLLPKGGNLWVKNAAREGALIAAMRKGVTLEVRVSSTKGAASTDSYSLSGFSQALERLQKECPGRT